MKRIQDIAAKNTLEFIALRGTVSVTEWNYGSTHFPPKLGSGYGINRKYKFIGSRLKYLVFLESDLERRNGVACVTGTGNITRMTGDWEYRYLRQKSTMTGNYIDENTKLEFGFHGKRARIFS